MGVDPTMGTRQRKPRSGLAVLLAALGVVLAVGLVSAVVAKRPDAPTPATLNGINPPTAPASVPVVSHLITYQLTGVGDALTITYVGQGADIEQVAEAVVPWSASVQHTSPEGSDQYFSLTARNAGSGSLGCRITVDGTTVSESTAGPQDVVRCSKSMS
ncbi:MmpS family transport accessory protein [Amycolatopsis sp. GM8]|uniref:MmpS family transport accessory protein n=1 Tax=Amycolatopsis sp. GM8 TaxID=2896530 RepID=UPI001F1D4D6D|nr:MmpS family transport accessory protein [Amycolatopsis sp. GM8]